DPRLVGKAVDVAVARASAAVLELPEPGGDALGEHARSVRSQVGGLEGLDQEPGFDPARRTRLDHDVLRGSLRARPVQDVLRGSSSFSFVSSIITAHRISSGASVEGA